jgi:hypothetical protein
VVIHLALAELKRKKKREKKETPRFPWYHRQLVKVHALKRRPCKLPLAELWISFYIALVHFFEDSFGAFKSWHCAGAVVGEVVR